MAVVNIRPLRQWPIVPLIVSQGSLPIQSPIKSRKIMASRISPKGFSQTDEAVAPSLMLSFFGQLPKTKVDIHGLWTLKDWFAVSFSMYTYIYIYIDSHPEVDRVSDIFNPSISYSIYFRIYIYIYTYTYSFIVSFPTFRVAENTARTCVRPFGRNRLSARS